MYFIISTVYIYILEPTSLGGASWHDGKPQKRSEVVVCLMMNGSWTFSGAKWTFGQLLQWKVEIRKLPISPKKHPNRTFLFGGGCATLLGTNRSYVWVDDFLNFPRWDDMSVSWRVLFFHSPTAGIHGMGWCSHHGQRSSPKKLSWAWLARGRDWCWTNWALGCLGCARGIDYHWFQAVALNIRKMLSKWTS